VNRIAPADALDARENNADRAVIVEALAELLLEALDDEDRRDAEPREAANEGTPRGAGTPGARPDNEGSEPCRALRS
jgi:hypothetical protein